MAMNLTKPAYATRDWQVSYWQIGCNDAKNGGKYNRALQFAPGYDNGWRHGVGQPRQLDEPLPLHYFVPDPPLKNPYMESIEALEGILQRLQTFANEFPQSLDRSKADEYRVELLKVRDDLSSLRQKEMVGL